MSLDHIVTAVGPKNGAPAADRIAEEQLISVATPSGLASIVVPCCGQLEYTKLCVPSLLKHTRQPFELIFLDIGSLDGTAEYLAGLAAGAGIRVEMVPTATDLGIAAAVARTIGDQHTLWMLVNLLARQFAVIHELQIAVAPVPLEPGVALFGESDDIAQTLVRTARLVAGAAMQPGAALDKAPAARNLCLRRNWPRGLQTALERKVTLSMPSHNCHAGVLLST
jgi:hypothetical protein